MVGERRGVKRDSFEKEYFTHIYNHRTPERDRVFKYHLQRILSNVPKVSKLLDVGCGLGYFLVQCRDHKIEAFGVDISRYAAKIARARANARISTLDASRDRWSYNPSTFDVVTAFDVIEHVYNSKFLLMEAHRVLKPGGLLYATTQNNQGNLGKLIEIFFPDDPTHINKKNSYGWKMELMKVGFRNISIRGIIFYGLPPITALRIKLEKLKIPVIIRPIFFPITYFTGVLVISAEK